MNLWETKHFKNIFLYHEVGIVLSHTVQQPHEQLHVQP
jgi:hypothetical protein